MVKEQVRSYRNSHPHPRGEAVLSLVKQVVAKHKQMRKEKGIDRAKDTAMAFGVIKELQSTADMLLLKGDYIAMRSRMDLLLAEAMMLRGEDRRKAEFPELFTIESINEGPKGNVQVLCLRLVGGKVYLTSLIPLILQTNQEGKSQYGLAFRHKDVERCAVGALALYLFVHVQNEPWPPFHDRERWYKNEATHEGGKSL